MNEYLKAQNKTNEAVLNNKFSNNELERFSKSDYRWSDNRSKEYRHTTVRKGEIYQFEFGKNFSPEMSYEHRGLVIGVRNKLLYVLPVFSYNPEKHTDVYHPIDHPESKSDMFLLKNKEFPFISHDSVLKLNDIRTISINRLLYKQPGKIIPSSDTYKKIEQLVLQKYFPSFSYEHTQLHKKLDALEKQFEEIQGSNEQLICENIVLKKEIESLKKKSSAEISEH